MTKKIFFKDLTKKERRHLHEVGITTLRKFKVVAAKQANLRESGPSEPCWHCRQIAVKLGLPI